MNGWPRLAQWAGVCPLSVRPLERLPRLPLFFVFVFVFVFFLPFTVRPLCRLALLSLLMLALLCLALPARPVRVVISRPFLTYVDGPIQPCVHLCIHWVFRSLTELQLVEVFALPSACWEWL